MFQDDVIETGSGGAAGLAFVDDTTFSLGEDARMVLDELIYDPATGDGSMSLAVIQGAFVFLTGEIAGSAEDAMVVTTPVADHRHSRHQGGRLRRPGGRGEHRHPAPAG